MAGGLWRARKRLKTTNFPVDFADSPWFSSFLGAFSVSSLHLEASLELFRGSADVVTVGALITACEAGGRWGLALDVLREAQVSRAEPWS